MGARSDCGGDSESELRAAVVDQHEQIPWGKGRWVKEVVRGYCGSAGGQAPLWTNS